MYASLYWYTALEKGSIFMWNFSTVNFVNNGEITYVSIPVNVEWYC